MRIDEIKVSAGRTFNHPLENYSNLRCDVHLNAKLDEGEDAIAATKQLQAQAEEIVERHKESLLKNIRDLERIARANQEVTELERRIAQANARIKELREMTPALHFEPARSSRDAQIDREMAMEQSAGLTDGGEDDDRYF